jgi:WD40 repeat protein
VFLIASCSDDDGPSGPGDNNPPVDVTLVAADRANGDIYEVDPTTGEETLLIDTWTDVVMRVPESLGRVSSIVYVPATSSWWLGGGGTATCAGCILILDPATGEAVTLSSPEGAHHGGGVSGMAIHPDNGRIFTFCSDCGNDFFEIDPATGAWTQLPDAVGTGGNGNGTTFSSDGVLHVASDGHLFRVDHTDSSVDDLGEFTYTGFPAFSGTRQPIVAMTTRPSDGAVFGILLDGGGQGNPGASYLIRVNLGTAEVTNVGKSDTMLGGLAFVPTAILD